jgi:hypothetical protein
MVSTLCLLYICCGAEVYPVLPVEGGRFCISTEVLGFGHPLH